MLRTLTLQETMKLARRIPAFSFLCLALLSLCACDRSWWNRGQPPSVATLIERSQNDLQGSLATYRTQRPDIASTAEQLSAELLAAALAARKGAPKADVLDPLRKATNEMIAIESNLSIGSRAAYGELSGQLRIFVDNLEKGNEPNPEALGLYTSRVIFFLANELTVPAPVA